MYKQIHKHYCACVQNHLIERIFFMKFKLLVMLLLTIVPTVGRAEIKIEEFVNDFKESLPKFEEVINKLMDKPDADVLSDIGKISNSLFHANNALANALAIYGITCAGRELANDAKPKMELLVAESLKHIFTNCLTKKTEESCNQIESALKDVHKKTIHHLLANVLLVESLKSQGF